MDKHNDQVDKLIDRLVEEGIIEDKDNIPDETVEMILRAVREDRDRKK